MALTKITNVTYIAQIMFGIAMGITRIVRQPTFSRIDATWLIHVVSDRAGARIVPDGMAST
jgi:hypothetical protein